MSSISFTAHGRCARATYCEPITTGSVGLSVSFAFDAAWSGLQKTAIFRGSGMAVDRVLSGDAATVPPEVLTIPGGDLRIGVWGADPDENVIIPTVWANVGEIVPGSAPSGIDPQPPTPSWAAQVQEIAQDALDTANSVREDADAGAFDGATYTPAVSAGGDLSWTNDKGKPNPPTVNIKGPEGQPGQTGATPDISIGTVETLPPGSPATATMTGTAENPVLSFGIPQGQQGAPGEVTQAEFDALADEVTQQKSAIEALDALVDRKAGMLIDTASGTTASFVPDATIDNLLGVTVAVEPVQDLHGQASPWPAGCGKNILNPADYPSQSTETQGITFSTNADGSISISGTATGTASFLVYAANSFPVVAGNYAMRLTFDGSITGNINFVLSGGTGGSGVPYTACSVTSSVKTQGKTFAATASGNLAYMQLQVTSGVTVSGKAYVQIQAGSTADDWSPYENICPIYGWSEVGIDVTGVNVWDEQWENGHYDGTTGGPVNNPSKVRNKNPIPVLPNTTYFIVTPVPGTNVFLYDQNMHYILKRTLEVTQGNTLTTPANAYFMNFSTFGSTYTTYNHDISINYPSNDHAYHPYTGNTYIIQLGDTFYGGTLDVTAGTLTVDRAMTDLGTLEWYESPSTTGNTRWSATLSTIKASPSVSEKPNLICSNYATISPNQSWVGTIGVSSHTANGTVLLVDPALHGYTRVQIKAALDGVQLAYEIATPFEIQLDPVTISTISGQPNNVWADAGDVTVEFAADLKHYIDSKIAAAVAALS